MHKGDLFKLLALKNESWWGTHQTLILNIDDQQKWYESIPSSQLFLIASKNDADVGLCVFTDIDHISRTANISGSVFKEHRNLDVVKPAFSCGLDFGFEMLNMYRLGAEVLEYHLAAQKLETDHLGSKVEGRRRKVVYKCGMYYDSICLGLLREEWEQQPRVVKLREKDGTCNTTFNAKRAERFIQENGLA